MLNVKKSFYMLIACCERYCQ